MNYKELNQDWKKNHPWDGCIDINERKKHSSGLGATPALMVAKKGDADLFKLIHENGADIEAKCCFRRSKEEQVEPIHMAAEGGHQLIVSYILGHVSNI